MEFKFSELLILADSILSQVCFDYLIPESDVSDIKDPLVLKENDARFDRVVLLTKVLGEILKNRPLPL